MKLNFNVGKKKKRERIQFYRQKLNTSKTCKLSRLKLLHLNVFMVTDSSNEKYFPD